MFVLALGLMCVSSNVALTGDDDALAVAQRTADAIDSAPGLTFSFEKRAVNAGGGETLVLRGRGRVSAPTEERGPLALLEGERLEGEESVPFVVWSDGDEVRVHDGGTSTVWTTRVHQCGVLLMESHGAGVLGPLTSSVTFRNLEAYGPKLGERTARGGVDCDVITMALPNGSEYRLAVGVEDALPREMIKPEGTASSVIVWSDLTVSEGPVAVPDAPEVPEGWRESPFGLGGPEVGDEAPAFDLVDRAGQRQALEDLRGKVVLLDFWASWCAPCIGSMPGLQALADDFADRGVVVIGARWSDSGDPSALLARLGVSYPIVDGSPIAEAYRVDRSGIPALYVIDGNGVVADYFLGYQGAFTEARVRRVVESLTG